MYAWSTQQINGVTYREITSLADLNAIGANMPAGTPAEQQESMSYYYYLVNDINCGGGNVNMIYDSDELGFWGLINLNGKRIYNGTIVSNVAGLPKAFMYRLGQGYIINGKIELNVAANTNSYAAGVCVFQEGGRIDRVAYSGNITATAGTTGSAATSWNGYTFGCR
jgi:hypothetical protein